MTRVQVVDRAALFDGNWPQGFTPFDDAAGRRFLDRALELARFVERPAAERTPAWKQWIPYCVVRCAPGPFPAQPGEDCGVLLVQRISGTSEARLHGAWSIGLGGHVEPDDDEMTHADGKAFFAAALLREIHEELDLGPGPVPTPQLLGLINDDSTEVGAVHAGLAYVLDLPMPLAAAAARVAVREVTKMRGGVTHLVGLRKLWLNPPQFESWSQVLLRAGIVGDMSDSNAAIQAHQG